VITINNAQRAYHIKTKELKEAARAMLAAAGYGRFCLGILLCGKVRMQKFNNEYRGKQAPTDVLSFPYHPLLKAGERIEAANREEENVGDIILCPQVIDKKRTAWDHSFDTHCIFLLAHAVAHLLGYDHETANDFEEMQKFEKKLLSAASSALPHYKL